MRVETGRQELGEIRGVFLAKLHPTPGLVPGLCLCSPSPPASSIPGAAPGPGSSAAGGPSPVAAARSPHRHLDRPIPPARGTHHPHVRSRGCLLPYLSLSLPPPACPSSSSHGRGISHRHGDAGRGLRCFPLLGSPSLFMAGHRVLGEGGRGHMGHMPASYPNMPAQPHYLSSAPTQPSLPV